MTVSPQDGLILKHAVDAGGAPDIMLRAPSKGPFEVEPLGRNYPIDLYGIPNDGRR